MKSKVSIVRCNSYNQEQIYQAIKKAVDLLGGIANFIKKGSKVLVKPNLLLATEPDRGVTTHPEVVRAVIRLLKEMDTEVFLGDSPSAYERIQEIQEVYEITGIKMIAQEEGVELVDFTRRRFKGNFPLTAWIDECDFIVNLPKFKTHNLTILSGAVKNLFGLVPGLYKLELHKRYPRSLDFSKVLLDIYRLVEPHLNIVDGVVAMEGEGPGTGGTLRNLGLIFASSDAIALDAVLAKIMGLEAKIIPTVREAVNRSIGNAELKQMEILGEELESHITSDFKLPSASRAERLPRPILEIGKKLVRFWVKIDNKKCIRCGRCRDNCPREAITIGHRGIRINYSKCINCFCCIEACPEAAIKIKKSILSRMLGI